MTSIAGKAGFDHQPCYELLADELSHDAAV